MLIAFITLLPVQCAHWGIDELTIIDTIQFRNSMRLHILADYLQTPLYTIILHRPSLIMMHGGKVKGTNLMHCGKEKT